MEKTRPVLDELKRIAKRPAEKPASPYEIFSLFKIKVQDSLKQDLARFHLKMRDIGETEFILYQGTQSNIWARCSVKGKIFYHTVLERQFERLGLIERGDDIVFRR